MKSMRKARAFSVENICAWMGNERTNMRGFIGLADGSKSGDWDKTLLVWFFQKWIWLVCFHFKLCNIFIGTLWKFFSLIKNCTGGSVMVNL